MKVALFSTDFQFNKVIDPVASRRAQRDVFVEGQNQVTFGGTYWYRMAMPWGEVGKHGHEIVVTWQMDNAPDGRLRVLGPDGHTWHDDCDVVVMQRWMHRDGVERIERAKATGQIIINDIDDYFWALPKSNVAHKTTDPKTNPDFNRDHYRANIAASSAITCSTQMIADALGRLGPPVFVCRNAIDIDRWPIHDPGSDGMIGWVGGIPWRGNDLTQLRGVLGPFLEEHGLPFYHGGDSDDPAYPKAWEQLGLDTNTTAIATKPLTSIADYPSLWEPVNLALVPLEQSSFNYAKSYLKGLEACACGIPFIATPTPEYRLLGAGRLAKTPNQWRAHLDELLDPNIRRMEGAMNRQRAEELSIGNLWPQWASVLDEVA